MNQKGFANIVLIIVIVTIIAVGGYFVFVKRSGPEAPVILVQATISDPQIAKVVKTTLEKNIDGGPDPEWKTECGYSEVYTKKISQGLDVYLLADCSFDYHKNDTEGKPVIGSVGSVPVHIFLLEKNNEYILNKFEQIRDPDFSDPNKTNFY
ncbi:MAG: hypothetical protein Q7K26_03510, partial [bacterium]|nr:hypothetical protein [bacterium]